jgi:hypothetical protein
MDVYVQGGSRRARSKAARRCPSAVTMSVRAGIRSLSRRLASEREVVRVSSGRWQVSQGHRCWGTWPCVAVSSTRLKKCDQKEPAVAIDKRGAWAAEQ